MSVNFASEIPQPPRNLPRRRNAHPSFSRRGIVQRCTLSCEVRPYIIQNRQCSGLAHGAFHRTARSFTGVIPNSSPKIGGGAERRGHGRGNAGEQLTPSARSATPFFLSLAWSRKCGGAVNAHRRTPFPGIGGVSIFANPIPFQSRPPRRTDCFLSCPELCPAPD